MANAGALGIQITADDAELRAVMRRAAEATVSAFSTMEGSAKQFKSVLEALGVATTVGGILAFARSAIDSAAALDDLAEKTGASVEQLSKLSQVARISGLGIETVETGLIRLAKALGGADEESKGAGQAFAKLGLDMEKLRGMDTADALKLVSTELNKYADGQGKTALALDIFGKSGAQLLPLLKDLGDAGNVNARVTAAQAAEAETLQKSLNKLAGDALDLKRALVLELVPGLQQVAEYIKSSKSEAEGFSDSFSPVTETFKALAVLGANVAFVFKGVGREIAGSIAKRDALIFGNKGDSSVVGDALENDAKKAREELEAYERSILNFDKLAKQRRDALAKLTDKDLDARDLRNRQQKLNYTSGGGKTGSGDDPAKKELDNRLKALEGASQNEKDIVTSTFKAIEIVAGQNLISFRDYYDVRRTIQENAVKKQQENYDAEIAALQDFKKKAAKETDRTEADGKIADIKRKKIQLDRTAADQVDEDTEKQRKAFKDLQNQIQLNSASVLELEGNLKEAAAIRFDVANQDIRARFVVEGRDDAVALLDTLRGYSIAQAEVNALNAEADRIGQQRANTETLIGIAQRNGAISELGSLQARTQARLKEIEDLEKIYDARLRIAQESGNPKLLQDAENLRVRLEELRSSADLLGQAFDNIFVSSAADAFSSFISGAKSAKQAFGDFVNSVVAQISKLAAQDLANALFKGGNSASGNGGGFFGFLGSLFGSSGSGFSSSTPGGMFTLPGEGWAKGGAFDGARRFANGGAFTNGIVDSPTFFNPAVMGEAGPEAIMPLARDGSGRLGVRGGGGGNNVNVTFNISTPDAGSFRASESQIAARMHAAIQSGLRNR